MEKKKKGWVFGKVFNFLPLPSTFFSIHRKHPALEDSSEKNGVFCSYIVFSSLVCFGFFLGIVFQQRSKTSPEKKDHLTSPHPCPFAASGWALRCQPQPCCVPVPAVVPSQEGPGKPGLETSPVTDFAAIPWSLPFAATGPISRQGLDGLHRSGSDPLKRGAGQAPTEPAARDESQETGTGISPPIS